MDHRRLRGLRLHQEDPTQILCNRQATGRPTHQYNLSLHGVTLLFRVICIPSGLASDHSAMDFNQEGIEKISPTSIIRIVADIVRDEHNDQ